MLRHAPQAARTSSTLGAHREAAAQYERALRFEDGRDAHTRASLYEGLAWERSLLDGWEGAEEARRIALGLRRSIGDDLHAGEDLFHLSRTLWRLCRGEEAADAAAEAVRVLEPLEHGRELAWAYANVSAFHMETGHQSAALDFGEKARTLGEDLREDDVVTYALNTIGCSLVETGKVDEGLGALRRSLAVALQSDLQESVGRAYCNMREITSDLHRFEDSERLYAEGIAYCEPRELGVYSTCLTGGHAVTLMLLGRWAESEALALEMLGRPSISPVNRMNPLIALGTIGSRRGDPDAQELLDEAVELAEGVAEAQWIAPTRCARAEYSWLSGGRTSRSKTFVPSIRAPSAV